MAKETTNTKIVLTQEEFEDAQEAAFDAGYDLSTNHETNKPKLEYKNFKDWFNKVIKL